MEIEIEHCASAIIIVQGKPWGQTSSTVLLLLLSCKGSHGDRHGALCFCYYYRAREAMETDIEHCASAIIIVQGKPWEQTSSTVLLLLLSCKGSHGDRHRALYFCYYYRAREAMGTDIEHCASAITIVQGKPWGQTSSTVLPLLLSCKGSHGDRSRALCFCYYYRAGEVMGTDIEHCASAIIIVQGKPWGQTSSTVLLLLLSCKGSHGDRNRALCFCYYYRAREAMGTDIEHCPSAIIIVQGKSWGQTWSTVLLLLLSCKGSHGDRNRALCFCYYYRAREAMGTDIEHCASAIIIVQGKPWEQTSSTVLLLLLSCKGSHGDRHGALCFRYYHRAREAMGTDIEHCASAIIIVQGKPWR